MAPASGCHDSRAAPSARIVIMTMTTIDSFPIPSTRPDRGQGAADVCATICTRNRTDKLRRALNSLMAQRVAPAEILIVDNAPQDDSTLMLIRNEFPAVRYRREPILGLDFARNRALRETTRDIVAYLDDDAVAEPDWVAATQAVFQEDSRIAVCTGKVDALCLETEGQRLFEAQGGFGRGDARIRLPSDAQQRRLHGMRAPLIAWSLSVGVGCSLAVRRQTIMALDGFDEALGMGDALHGGDDVDIIWRTLDAGYEVVYEPAVRARHEHRREVEAAINQILGHRRAEIALLVKTAGAAHGAQRLVIFAFLIWRLAKPGLRLTRRVLLGRDPLPAQALLRLWWSCWRGLVAYPAAKRLARQRASEAGQLRSS
jgi:GT2 family glycosyltransferase